MSYEGRLQCICESGHYFACDDPYEGGVTCPVCNQRPAWVNRIDDTNCDSVGEIPESELEKRFLIRPVQVETCNQGHRHGISEALFKIPTNEETDPLRCYRPGYGNTELIPLNRPTPDRKKKRR